MTDTHSNANHERFSVQHTTNFEGEGLGVIDFSDLELPPAITPRSTRKQRQFAHKAKMEGKRYNAEHLGDRRTQIRTRAQLRSVLGVNSIAQRNRHTGKPHEHARERMRNTMTIAKRRAFAAQVAAQLEGVRN